MDNDGKRKNLDTAFNNNEMILIVTGKERIHHIS